ncbi:chemotaxis protein CheX [Campylobacter sp. RM9344]|uniref:Chemotaxis protein CheX n=1 Tax=Campylobacter californiensis TaxID=1032243 RepID=A0AAW3ZUZ1_9BACT|nr:MULTISPECIES: chemotaxis protein CheX [unclassified Campylobacter]MBE2984176.1 chemotaxis protein CheX [Campylobacter sp. RM6883]MBE2986200.1 chemotaxis protein CheX [Campylobacter sp. RM12919]MBE2988197.1 chemotaxis protein CheX [Campylobacter sp. RM12920]MBE2995545.1 chemotaxis protein CheX [Campylobacter sp. RM6913]MBE3022645.1 chemotaxis protein CheX [Campylobacter sp. 7477a]MBE3029786.1 chemotaxis protein CheX [Campylobacter sp. RM9344]
MKNVIDVSTRYLCSDTLGFKLESGSSIGNGFYGASIPVYKGKEEYHFYLFFKKDTLRIFLEAFFGVKEFEGNDLDDLCKEIANMIIGKAKNLLNEQEDDAYKLGTPEFLGEVDKFHVKLDEKFIYKMKNRTFQIGYKKA